MSSLPPGQQGTPWRRIGVFGGTFDPIHVGHLASAVNARYALDLDVVLLVVAHKPWQKEGSRAISPSLDRLALVRASVGDVEGVEASDLEIARGGTSYTADTLIILESQYPDAEFFVIIGCDVAQSLYSWARADEVSSRATLVIVNRPGFARTELDAKWRVIDIDVPEIELSSTELRARAADGRPLDYLIPADGIAYINANRMYK